MKRFVSMVLGLALVVMALPITCFALEVGGTASWNYDEETSTLTLNNFSSTNNVSVGEETYQIYHNGDLNIILEGENTLDLESDYGIYVEGNLTIRGTGSLNIPNATNSIYATKNFVIQSGNYTAATIAVKGGGITIESGEIRLTGDMVASEGFVTINQGEIYAARIASKDITVNNGNINAYIYGTNLVEINDGKVTSDRLYVERYKTLKINGGTVEIKTDDRSTAVDAGGEIYVTGGNLIIENTYENVSDSLVQVFKPPFAIYGSQRSLNISGGNVKIKGNIIKSFSISAGTLEVEGMIHATVSSEINGGTVTVKGEIYSQNDLIIRGGIVNVESNSIGLYADDNISISGGEISVYGESQALKAGGTITISSDLAMKTGTSASNSMDASNYYSEKYISLVKKIILGDIDGVEGVTSDDAVYLLGYTLYEEYYPISQPCDFDGNGEVNSDDAVYLLGYTLYPDYYPLH